MKIFTRNREWDILTTYNELVDAACLYWYQASRKKKHRDIASGAKAAKETLGPFPLVYADPPWKFATYSEKGLERTPDQHYPTLTDEEIIDFEVNGKTVPESTAKSAVLLLWCTSSNILRALAVLDAWGFTYKTQGSVGQNALGHRIGVSQSARSAALRHPRQHAGTATPAKIGFSLPANASQRQTARGQNGHRENVSGL